MIGSLSAQPILTVREVAPKCPRGRALSLLHRRGTCKSTCYERALLCQFRSTFDAYEAPMAPWRTGAFPTQRARALFASSRIDSRRCSCVSERVLMSRGGRPAGGGINTARTPRECLGGAGCGSAAGSEGARSKVADGIRSTSQGGWQHEGPFRCHTTRDRLARPLHQSHPHTVFTQPGQPWLTGLTVFRSAAAMAGRRPHSLPRP